MKFLSALLLFFSLNAFAAGVTYEGKQGPGHGKYIVLVAGDDAEYHSEEALPQLAKILAFRHGFKCTVLFSINPDDGTIEAEAASSFTLADADCGKLAAVGHRYNAEPDPNATALYDFQIKPRGNEMSTVDVHGTFTAPLHVPLRPVRGEQCQSRGTQEARLLREISQQAQDQHPPLFTPPPISVPARQSVE